MKCILKGGSQNGREIDMPNFVNEIVCAGQPEQPLIFNENQKFVFDPVTSQMIVHLPREHYRYVGLWVTDTKTRVYEFYRES